MPPAFFIANVSARVGAKQPLSVRFEISPYHTPPASGLARSNNFSGPSLGHPRGPPFRVFCPTLRTLEGADPIGVTGLNRWRRGAGSNRRIKVLQTIILAKQVSFPQQVTFSHSDLVRSWSGLVGRRDDRRAVSGGFVTASHAKEWPFIGLYNLPATSSQNPFSEWRVTRPKLLT